MRDRRFVQSEVTKAMEVTLFETSGWVKDDAPYREHRHIAVKSSIEI
jgi:hypothetical protein